MYAPENLEAVTPATSVAAEDKVLQTIGAPLDMPSKVSAHSLSPSPGGSRPRYGRAHLLQPSPAVRAVGAVQQETSTLSMGERSTDDLGGATLPCRDVVPESVHSVQHFFASLGTVSAAAAVEVS